MTPSTNDTRPCAGAERALLVLPSLRPDHPEHGDLTAFRELILRELPELEAEVGCPVTPSDTAMLPDDQPAILVGPATWNEAITLWQSTRPETAPGGPYVAIDRRSRRVIIDAPDLGGVGGAFQLLRTAIAEGRDLLVPSTCETVDAVIDRIDAEVRRTFPRLTSRVPGWERHIERARACLADADDLAGMQRLMATLGDAHSWAKDTRINGRLPYHLFDNGTTARFWAVPEWSVAWAHGVRPGDVVIAPDTAPWRDRTGSVPRTKPWNIGYRAMQGRVGETVALAATRRDGSEARWTEPIPSLPWDIPIEVGRIDARTGFMRVHGWLNSPQWHDAFASALSEMAPYERLVVDLRGNVGGALVAAQNARSRFLTDRTHLGSIRFSTVSGEMDRSHDLHGEPPERGPRWTKPVRFLTDPLCYSATEDFLHGLKGLPHVQVVGQTTGGGSGRPRTISLRPNMVATVSTALTYDREGHCIEGNGIAPDIPIALDVDHPDSLLSKAMRGW